MKTGLGLWHCHCFLSYTFCLLSALQKRTTKENILVNQQQVLQIRRGFNNPSHGNFPLKGSPPGASTDKILPKSWQKFLSKNRRSIAKNCIFCSKTPFLGQFLMDFFLTEKGAPPPPPPRKVAVTEVIEASPNNTWSHIAVSLQLMLSPYY